MKRKTIVRIITIGLPILIAVLLMIPRLTSAQFGLLDDGAMMAEVRQILNGDLSMSHDLQAGRFRPLYWVYFTLIYSLVGPHAFWFYFAQSFLLVILVIEIQILMKKIGTLPWQRVIANLLFVLSLPIVENFYTLSKGEPLQLLFILIALIAYEQLKSKQVSLHQWWLVTIISVSILAAALVKETSIVILPIAAVWAGMPFVTQNQKPKNPKSAGLLFLFAVLLGILAAFGLRALWGTPSITAGTYTERYDLSLMSILARVARWTTLYGYYFHYLLPLAILTVILFIQGRLNKQPQVSLVINWMIWCGMWIAALIPWEFTEVYYLLPFSLGISILISLLAPYLINGIKESSARLWLQKTLLGFSIGLFFATLPVYFTHAGIQLTIDRINQDMLRSVQKITPQNGEVFIGMELQNEFVINIERFLLDRYGRTDINYGFVNLETLGGLHHYSKGILVLPYVRNLPDLILRTGVEQNFTNTWREIIIYEMGDRLKELDRERGAFPMVNINLPVLFCPFLGTRGFCETPDPLIDTREFRFGWEVYQIR